MRDWQSWQLAFFTVPYVAVQFIACKERELLAWYFWHWSYNPDAIGQEDFEVYVRQLQKPGAMRAPRVRGHGTCARVGDVTFNVLRLAEDRVWLLADRSHDRYLALWLARAMEAVTSDVQ